LFIDRKEEIKQIKGTQISIS